MSPNHQPRKRARTPPGRQTRTRVWRNRSPPDFHLLEIPMCWNTVRVHQGEGWEIGKMGCWAGWTFGLTQYGHSYVLMLVISLLQCSSKPLLLPTLSGYDKCHSGAEHVFGTSTSSYTQDIKEASCVSNPHRNATSVLSVPCLRN
ncbi:neuropeptide Y receptor type 5 isoform X8 [Carettochelys insculpta]|uniref:neuropeptide Y receptor type 5 isoform X8 n=1 Tax=Carettochelys insculpta TaxID=44489 RepID=UPI003EBCD6EE